MTPRVLPRYDDDFPFDRRERPSGALEGAQWAQTPAANRRDPSFRPPTTAGQRRRFERNVVLLAAHRQGCSLNMLARVFGMSRVHVQRVVADMGALAPREP